MDTLNVSNLAIDVVRKDIKNIHLAVYPPTWRIRLAAPFRVTDESIRLFAISKISWIRKHQKKFFEQMRQSPREFVSGESHYFFGSRYILEVVESDMPGVSLKGKSKILLSAPAGWGKERREALITEWYRRKLKTIVPDVISKWEERMGVKSSDWRVKKMKTKWGTCNIRDKRVWLNLELAKKPMHAIEYVVVHELAHLLERKHNDRFVAIMDEHFPTWRTVKAELNDMVS